MSKAPKSVEAYLRSVPKKARAKLIQLRRIIKAAAPKALERISYGMPFYEYRGRLAYFRLAKTYLGVYIPTPVIAGHEKEAKEYAASKATLHLPLDKKLPAKLIRKLIKARVKMNEEKGGTKT